MVWRYANKKVEDGFKAVKGGKKDDLKKLACEHGYDSSVVETVKDGWSWVYIIPKNLAEEIVHYNPNEKKKPRTLGM